MSAGPPGGTLLGRRPVAPLTVPEVAARYRFPRELDGSGQCIGLLAFNTPPFDGAAPAGGYLQVDLDEYFHGLGRRAPRVEAVHVGAGRNLPGKHPRADIEITLGISVAGAVAPGARLAVYFAPNTEAGVHAGIVAAIDDQVRRPSVICMSWGAPERSWSSRWRQAVNAACRRAASAGVTVVASSGDRGEVEFPASSPWVLACGGSRLSSRGETVWNEGDGQAGGGGHSGLFRAPAWQKQFAKRGRGVPDVCAHAAFDNGYRIIRDGQPAVGGGTSAAAPLWAGLIALLNQGLGRPIGHLTPLLYGKLAGKVCRAITEGGTGRFRAARGWNPSTGWGSPDGRRLLAALR